MAKEWKTSYPPSEYALDFDDFSRPHECPMGGGARRYAMFLDKIGRWPPPAPVFHIAGNTLFRRWIRHIWLEVDAGFGMVAVVGGLPGLGKSITMRTLGKLYNEDYNDAQILGDADEIVEAVQDETTPHRMVLGDEALANFLWSMLYQDSGQKNVIKTVWKHARKNKHPIVFVAQQEDAMAWIIRDGLARWWVRVRSRDPVTNVKYASLFHGVPSYFRDRATHGYRMGTRMFYYRGGDMTIPAASASEDAVYEERRERILEDEVPIIGFEARERRRRELGFRPTSARSSSPRASRTGARNPP